MDFGLYELYEIIHPRLC